MKDHGSIKIMIKEPRFKIRVMANSNKNELLGFDDAKKAYILKIKAKPEDNKANIEIIKFLTKLLKRRARIVSGLKSKEKIIQLDQ